MYQSIEILIKKRVTLTTFLLTIFILLILRKRRFVVFGAVAVMFLVVIGIGVGLYFGFQNVSAEPIRFRGAVVTNGHECSAIGGAILEKGGSAVDAAIAALFCEGIAMPQSMGLGGGFLMTVYIRETKKSITLNAREAAPILATENMYNGNASLASKGRWISCSCTRRITRLSLCSQKVWKVAMERTCKAFYRSLYQGHLVTSYFSRLFESQEKNILKSPTLSEVFIDPKTNHVYKEGEYIKRPKLAETLRIIADEGPETLYTGSLSKGLSMTFKLLAESFPLTICVNTNQFGKKQIISKLPFNDTLHTSPLPGSGVILAFILNILNGFLDYTNLDEVKNWQRIVESFKYGYGKRTELGDPKFVPGIDELIRNLTSPKYASSIRKLISDSKTFQDPRHYGANVSLLEDHATAHISVLAPNGDAVAVTSTINLFFGAGIRSQSTGIILNNEMNDFSAPNITNAFDLPPSPANFIVPHKRPQSSMCPSIVVNKHGDAILIIGAAGGTKITTSVALVTLRTLKYKKQIKPAVIATRINHQLFPMELSYEKTFNKEMMEGLRFIGHDVSCDISTNGFAAMTAITNINGVVEATADRRRSGQAQLVR